MTPAQRAVSAGSTARMFAGMYKGHFKTVRDVYKNDDPSLPRYNNRYVDEHRERFELPAKPKEKP